MSTDTFTDQPELSELKTNSHSPERLRICAFAGVLGLLSGVAIADVTSEVLYEQNFENYHNADGLWSTDTRASLGGTWSTVLGRFSSQRVTLNLYANDGNSTGGGSTPGGGDGTRPFNITVDQHNHDRIRQPHLDSSGGGSSGSSGGTNPDVPTLNLGGAVRDSDQGNSEPRFGPGMYRVRWDLMLFDSWDGDYKQFGPDTFSLSVNGDQLFHEVLQTHAPEFNFKAPDEIPEQNVYHQRWTDIIYRDLTVEFELTEATDLLSIEFFGDPSQDLLDESWGMDNVIIEYLPSVRSASLDVPAPGSLALFGLGSGCLFRRRRSTLTR